MKEYSFFSREKKMIKQAEALASHPVDNPEKIRACLINLIGAFRRSYREQACLIRVSDRLQEQLRLVTEELLVKTKLLEQQALDMKRLNEDLAGEIVARRRAEAELRVMADTDVLTGVYNRRRFLEILDEEIRRAGRNGDPLCFMLLDIDRFKSVNDQHSHVVGDQVLRRFTCALRDGIRERDVVGRLGGEEFSILLPRASVQNAAAVAERLRSNVADLKFNGDGCTFHITASIGVTQFRGNESGYQLIARADAAMYTAKQKGRNRVEKA